MQIEDVPSNFSHLFEHFLIYKCEKKKKSWKILNLQTQEINKQRERQIFMPC